MTLDFGCRGKGCTQHQFNSVHQSQSQEVHKLMVQRWHAYGFAEVLHMTSRHLQLEIILREHHCYLRDVSDVMSWYYIHG